MNLVKQKIAQTFEILGELEIDAWLIFVRESSMMRDPSMPLVVGHDVTWQSVFLYTREGQAYALVGNFDHDNFVNSGCFEEVLTYTQDIKPELVKLLEKVDPKKLAINYSTNNESADGLTHGMYLLLQKYLKDTPYGARFESSEEILSKVRSRKTDDEVALLKEAAVLADDVWQKAINDIVPGMTEQQVAAVLEFYIYNSKNRISFNTIANAGSKTDPGHGEPTEAKLETGDLLHVDFGIKHKGYCSDIQRLLYLKKPTDKTIPEELQKAFNLVRDIITETATMCKPGALGCDIDTAARKMLREAGYTEYQHALGHQLGRNVHDGGALIGPKWARYGKLPEIALEKNNVVTLELEIILPNIGCVGLEEDVVVLETGGQFLSPRQMELVIK